MHSEVYVGHGRVPPISEMLVLVLTLRKLVDSRLDLVPHLVFAHSALQVPLSQVLVLMDQHINNISQLLLFHFFLVVVFVLA